MEWRIELCDKSETVRFAADELAKYLKLMSPATQIAILNPEKPGHMGGTLRLQVGDGGGGGAPGAGGGNGGGGGESIAGCGDNKQVTDGCGGGGGDGDGAPEAGASGVKLPAVDNPELDDAYCIDVCNGAGFISGVNARSVLLGAYRLLREMGCRWLRPGADGEIVPRADVDAFRVACADAASYRHRGVCIEGACSYTHVADMIDWLPKIGMNAYFNQFFVPYTFFDRWYRHEGNPYMRPEPASVEQVDAMVKSHIGQIKKRGLMYHATGHGWTCEPFGIEGNSWTVKDYEIPDETRDLLAMIDGKRGVYGGIALNTNLCYSNPVVRDRVASAIKDYCLKCPEVDYLHFWLADGINNHCECENCQDTRPSDFYVQMLNEVDKRLTAADVKTKIVFLIYVDLLWEPQTYRLINQDRFTLMFAPITRTYTNSFFDSMTDETFVLEPYTRNKLTMPKQVGENIQRLRNWQEQFAGDSFDFDYHLMWDHNLDPGGIGAAKVLFEDMKNLDKLGLNGMMSCQCTRAFFPTGLSMYAMGEALWNKALSFEEAAANYFTDLFAENGVKMLDYFKGLSDMFDPMYLRGEKPVVNAENARQFLSAICRINEMLPYFHDSMIKECVPRKKKTWQAVALHGQLCVHTLGALNLKALGNNELAAERWSLAKDYALRIEPEVHDLFDAHNFINVVGRVFM